MNHDIELVHEDNDHWRWFCSCGSKGIRLIYKESVERLAAIHIKSARDKNPE